MSACLYGNKLYIYISNNNNNKTNNDMKATTIANQIKAQITDLKANNQFYDLTELVYDYTAQSSTSNLQDIKLREELFELLR